MKKLFTLTLCMLACLAINARVIYGTGSDTYPVTSAMHSGSVTVEGDVITFPNAWWNGLTIDATKGIDLKGYGKFSYTFDSYAIGEETQASGVPFRIELLDADGNNISTSYGISSIILPPNCTKVVLNPTNPNIKVKNLQLIAGDKATSVTDDNMASLRELSTNNDYSGWVNNIPAFPKTLNQATVAFGNGEGSNESVWADVSDYEKLTFVVSDVATAGSQLRVWMWNGSGVTTLYPHLESEYESVTNWTALNTVTVPGTYVVKLAGYSCLKGVKTNWDGATCTVSDIYLTQYEQFPIIDLYPVNSVNTLKVGAGKSWADISFPASINNSIFWGSHDANINNWVDISDAKSMTIELTSGSDQFRAFVWNEENNSRDILYFYPEGQEGVNWKIANTITGPGKFVVNLEGYSKLMGVKPYGGGGKVAAAYVSKDGYADVGIDEARTFSSIYSLDFTDVEDVEAYIAVQTSANSVKMQKVTGSVPANTGLVLKQVNNKTIVSIPACKNGTEDVSENLLVPTTAKTTLNAGYVLAGTGEQLGWYAIGAAKPTLDAGKAYLPEVSSAKQLSIIWDDEEVTATEGVKESTTTDDAWYTISGIKVAQPKKGGMYINNGKAIVF